MGFPAPPTTYNSQISADLADLREAFERGDINPAIVLRRIVGRVHGSAYNDGYAAASLDHSHAERGAE